mmetsp:Transcript_105964/g.309925  ORF Transcript_105964/g.309925 Transcript_105964/m.309925 type:complete len:590 (-) Transcript_105964:88-1857(-)
MASFMRHTVTETNGLRIGGVNCFSPVRSHQRLPPSTSLPALPTAGVRRLPDPPGSAGLFIDTWPSLAQAAQAQHSPELPTPVFQARAPELLLPGESAANDAMRVRNNGKPLQPRCSASLIRGSVAVREARRSLGESPSTPALSSRSVPLAERPGQLKRCVVKSVDMVGINYPDFTPLSAAPPPSKSPSKENWPQADRKVVLKPRGAEWSELPPPEVEELANLETSLSPQGRASEALRKSAKKMEGMRLLRRLSADAGEQKRSIDSGGAAGPSRRQSLGEEEGEQPAQQAVEEEDPLLQKMLKELGDTEASLREKISEIEETQRVVDQCGGNRHATAVMTSRTVAVMKRKAELLSDVETRLSEFEAAHAGREALLGRMTSGDLEAPPALCGVKKFISIYVHRPGDPVDADKSDFNAFAKSFLLPSKHGVLERFRAVAEEASDWWAKTSASVAGEGGEKEIIKALMTLAISAGAEKDHAFILRAEVILKDRIADRVLKEAKEAQERDKIVGEKAEMVGQVPVVGMAEKAADAITLAVRTAVKDGVEESDKRIVEAKAVAKALRETDGVRKRMANREKNLAKQAAAKSAQKA